MTSGLPREHSHQARPDVLQRFQPDKGICILESDGLE